MILPSHSPQYSGRYTRRRVSVNFSQASDDRTSSGARLDAEREKVCAHYQEPYGAVYSSVRLMSLDAPLIARHTPRDHAGPFSARDEFSTPRTCACNFDRSAVLTTPLDAAQSQLFACVSCASLRTLDRLLSRSLPRANSLLGFTLSTLFACAKIIDLSINAHPAGHSIRIAT